MTARLLRLVYTLEFLIALVAIFTAWPEIGGQAALDLMHWAWKLGLGFALAVSIVLYTAALVATDSVWTLRSARWLMVIVLVMVIIGIVTYYYALQVNTGESDETDGVSMSPGAGLLPAPLA